MQTLPLTPQEEQSYNARYNATIPVRLRYELPIQITKSNCSVTYKYTTTNPQERLGFGIYFKDSLSGIESVVKAMDRRTGEKDQPDNLTLTNKQNGSLVLISPGLLLFRWDNSYSWLTSKELTYDIDVSEVI